MRINLRSRQTTVTQKLFHRTQLRIIIQHRCGKSMSQHVRTTLFKRYHLRKVPQMIGMMKHTYSNVPDEFWKNFEEQLSEKANTQFLDIYVSIYHRYLTISDLKKITAFYESPVGKKLAESTPVMTAEAMEAGQQIGMGIAKEIMANLKEKGYVQ